MVILAHGRPSVRRIARYLAVIGAGLAVVLTGLAGAAPASARSVHLPADPQQHGYIGLCNTAGRNVTGGSIDAKPFVWKAVSSTRPDKAFQGKGANAVLAIYQVRPEVDPDEWSGNSLTAASFYTSSHPAAQATYIDVSLRQFMKQFPPMDNGLYALRFSYGKLNYGIYRATYPVTVIQVRGSRWKVVRGGTVSCASGHAVSQEQLTGVATKAQYTAHRPSGYNPTAKAGPGHIISSSPAAVATSRGARGGNGAGIEHAGADAQNASSDRSTSDTGGWLLWLGLGVGVLGITALVVAARRRRTSTSDITP